MYPPPLSIIRLTMRVRRHIPTESYPLSIKYSKAAPPGAVFLPPAGAFSDSPAQREAPGQGLGDGAEGSAALSTARPRCPRPLPPAPPFLHPLRRPAGAGSLLPSGPPRGKRSHPHAGGRGRGHHSAPPVPPASGRGRSVAPAALPPCAAAPAWCHGQHPPPGPRPTGGGATPG